MISWQRFIPVLGLAFATAIFVSTYLVFANEERFGGTPTLTGADGSGESLDRRPTAVGQDPPAPRATAAPNGLTEITMNTPDRIRIESQRAALTSHLKSVRLAMLVPDAMSFASRRRGPLWILSAASGPETGFFLFSEKGGRQLVAANARRFLREFFKDAFALPLIDADEKFLSRGLGELTWIRGQSLSAQKFDAYAVPAKRGGFAHLLFVYDPAVAIASRRQMIDSMRVK